MFGYPSQKAYADSLGINPATLSAFMNEDRPPSKFLLAALGYEKVTEYRKVEKVRRPMGDPKTTKPPVKEAWAGAKFEDV